MPYTPAHPITAIALIWMFPNRFNKTGLVIGTMAPDLQNFIELRPADTGFGHSALGMLTYGLPASIVLAFAFHRLVMPAAAVYLPKPLNRIAAKYWKQGWSVTGVRSWAVFLLSIALGMYSHLFLDGFSHKGGLMYPFATATVEWMMPGVKSPGGVVQFVLSIVGIGIELLLLRVFVYRRREEAAVLPDVRFRTKALFWLLVASAIVLVTLIGMLMYRPHHFHHFRYMFYILPIAPLTGAVLGIIAASALHALFFEKWNKRMHL
ncbi:DUF4184 family protein [Paenibacillus ginsengarvi]|nr:DUF4184 family protein [Paenibacillus ginsengarvi]